MLSMMVTAGVNKENTAEVGVFFPQTFCLQNILQSRHLFKDKHPSDLCVSHFQSSNVWE